MNSFYFLLLALCFLFWTISNYLSVFVFIKSVKFFSSKYSGWKKELLYIIPWCSFASLFGSIFLLSISAFNNFIEKEVFHSWRHLFIFLGLWLLSWTLGAIYLGGNIDTLYKADNWRRFKGND